MAGLTTFGRGRDPFGNRSPKGSRLSVSASRRGVTGCSSCREPLRILPPEESEPVHMSEAI